MKVRVRVKVRVRLKVRDQYEGKGHGVRVRGHARELRPEFWISHPLGSPSSPLAWLTNTVGGSEGNVSRRGSRLLLFLLVKRGKGGP